MSIRSGQGVGGRRQVYMWNPEVRTKRYVGTIGPCSGNGNARTCRCSECKAGRKLENESAAIFAQRPKHADITVKSWAEKWLDGMHGPGTSRPSTTTLKHNTERLRALIAEHGSRPLASITDDEASDFAMEHPGRVKVTKAMFADAERRGRIPYDPFRHVKAPKGNGRDDIFPLTESEVARLAEIARTLRDEHGLLIFGAFREELAALVTFAAWTGLRPGEICGLEWTEVDLSERRLHVQWQRRKDGARVRTKTSKNRVVPLEDIAMEALSRVPKRPGPVFRAQGGGTLRPEMLSLYWRPIRDAFAAELAPSHWLSRRLRHDPDDRLTFYEVRHNFGSVLGDQGLSARDISEVMGNSPAVCEKTYVHPFQNRVQDRVRAALARAAEHLSESPVGTQDGTHVA